MKILLIDAWGNKKEGFEWNAWYTVGEIAKNIFEALETDKQIAQYFFVHGFTTNSDMRQIRVEDDQYNKVIIERKTGRPLFAIEYGPEY